MSPKFLEKQSTRIEKWVAHILRRLPGSALLPNCFPASLLSTGVPGRRQQAAKRSTGRLAAMREHSAVPIQAQPLAEKLTLLSGPGGNVVVLNGPMAKSWSTTFLFAAWPKLKGTLDGWACRAGR